MVQEELRNEAKILTSLQDRIETVVIPQLVSVCRLSAITELTFSFFLPWTFDLNSHLLLLPSERPELDRHLPPVLGSKYLCRFHSSDLTCFATIFCSVLNTFCSDSYRREWRTCWGLWEWSKTFSTQIQNRLSGRWVESEEIYIIKKKTFEHNVKMTRL